MKHTPATCRKYYSLLWANREAVRLSLSCAEHFHIDRKINVKMVLKDRERVLNNPLPDKDTVAEWVERQRVRIEKDKEEQLQDPSLQQCFDSMQVAFDTTPPIPTISKYSK